MEKYRVFLTEEVLKQENVPNILIKTSGGQIVGALNQESPSLVFNEIVYQAISGAIHTFLILKKIGVEKLGADAEDNLHIDGFPPIQPEKNIPDVRLVESTQVVSKPDIEESITEERVPKNTTPISTDDLHTRIQVRRQRGGKIADAG